MPKKEQITIISVMDMGNGTVNIVGVGADGVTYAISAARDNFLTAEDPTKPGKRKNRTKPELLDLAKTYIASVFTPPDKPAGPAPIPPPVDLGISG